MALADPDEFWNNVLKTADCWLWLRGHDKDGYGTLRNGDRKDRAHRVAYELTFGEIPKGFYIMHECDNPGCVRPDHLTIGTALDNNRDMVIKGRARPHRVPGRTWCKIDDETAQIIVQRHLAGETQTSLAREYGISQQLVSRFVVEGRKTWI